MPALSVVIITRNQEWNVARLVESALQYTANFPDTEVILVDSASTDATVEIASRYPITVLQLAPDQQLTASAGRYLGFKHTTGDYVLFLDGDMALCEGFVDHALPVFEAGDDRLAVLTGQRLDRPVDTPTDSPRDFDPADYTRRAEEVQHPGGAGLFRRDVLAQVGSWNPFLYSDEEPELCVRIQYAGYVIHKIDYPIAYHYSDPIDEISTLVARRSRNLWLGVGQSIRLHLGSSIFWPYIRKRGYGILPGIALVAGVIALLVGMFGRQMVWFRLWVLALAGVIVLDSLRKRSLYLTLHSLVKRFFVVDGMVRGFFQPVGMPEDYPAKFDVIKQADES